MDLTELTTVLVTLLGVLTPLGGLGAVVYRKQEKRLKDSEARLAEVNVEKARIESKTDEWHFYKEQLDVANGRIVELLRINAEKEDRHQQDIREWEERFTNQTSYLRGVQRDLIAANEREKEHIRKEGVLMRRIQYVVSFICKRSDCDHGIPPRGHLAGCVFDEAQIGDVGQVRESIINLDKN